VPTNVNILSHVEVYLMCYFVSGDWVVDVLL